jgi:hypothetical protein
MVGNGVTSKTSVGSSQNPSAQISNSTIDSSLKTKPKPVSTSQNHLVTDLVGGLSVFAPAAAVAAAKDYKRKNTPNPNFQSRFTSQQIKDANAAEREFNRRKLINRLTGKPKYYSPEKKLPFSTPLGKMKLGFHLFMHDPLGALKGGLNAAKKAMGGAEGAFLDPVLGLTMNLGDRALTGSSPWDQY